MSLNSPKHLSLGRLGHIAGGNSATNDETRLGNTCRGSTGTRTAMWADFRIGSISFNEVTRLQGNESIDDGYLIISVPSNKDVGIYMGSTSSGTDYYVSQLYNDLRPDDDITIEIAESSPGSLYVSRIQNRSINSADYVFSTTSTGINFGEEQDGTSMDKFRLQELE